jgi:hypothetical protein
VWDPGREHQVQHGRPKTIRLDLLDSRGDHDLDRHIFFLVGVPQTRIEQDTSAGRVLEGPVDTAVAIGFGHYRHERFAEHIWGGEHRRKPVGYRARHLVYGVLTLLG